MIKKIKFNILVDNQRCRTIDELRNNFNLVDVFELFKTGKLEKWLKIRKFSELESILEIDKEASEDIMLRELCRIFIIEFSDDLIADELMYSHYKQLSDKNKNDKALVKKIFDQFKVKEVTPPKKDKKDKKDKNTKESFNVSDKEGVVFDKETNLTWLRYALGAELWDATVPSKIRGHKIYRIKAAGEEIYNFNYSIHPLHSRDWRLPTINELKTLVNENEVGLDDNIFKVSADTYMSSEGNKSFNFRLNKENSGITYTAILLVRDNG